MRITEIATRLGAVALLWPALAGCEETPRPATAKLAQRIAEAHGMKAWQAKRAVAAEITAYFGGQEMISGSMVYDHHQGRVRMETGAGAVLVFDGATAWVSPASATVPMARFQLLTWPYFLAAPFKLQDPGSHLAETEPLALDGRTHETARLTFDPGVGESPDDWYILYADPDTHRLAAMAYIVTYGATLEKAEEEPHSIVYHDFVVVDGVTLPARWTFHHWSAEQGPHGDPIGRVELANLRFVEPDDAAFARPAGAKEEPLPPG